MSSWSTFPLCFILQSPSEGELQPGSHRPQRVLVSWERMEPLLSLYKTNYLSIKSVSCPAPKAFLTRLNSGEVSVLPQHLWFCPSWRLQKQLSWHIGDQETDRKRGGHFPVWAFCHGSRHRNANLTLLLKKQNTKNKPKKNDGKCLCIQLLFPSCSWTDGALSCFINVISESSL